MQGRNQFLCRRGGGLRRTQGRPHCALFDAQIFLGQENIARNADHGQRVQRRLPAVIGALGGNGEGGNQHQDKQSRGERKHHADRMGFFTKCTWASLPVRGGQASEKW